MKTPIMMTKKNNYFPIKTDTACKLKWAWSTLYLNGGITASCHRSAMTKLESNNFDNFHNTEKKISDRKTMLDGKWPGGGCNYCERVEIAGGYSDRMLHNSIPNNYPSELDHDIVLELNPSILEVYFNNICNLSCIYCLPHLSSKLNEEYEKYGEFNNNGVTLVPLEKKFFKDLEEPFWKWMHSNFIKLTDFNILGGEPFLQKQLDILLKFINDNPNFNCNLTIISNLSVPNSRILQIVKQIRELIKNRKLKSFTINASIDCWGPEQEYIRTGIDLTQWQTNFEYLLAQKWIKLNINQTISGLSIKTMPTLLISLGEWKKLRPVGHYFSAVEPGPSYLRPNIFGPGVFNKDFTKILSLMHNNTSDEQRAYKYMCGIANEIEKTTRNTNELKKMLIFLNEKDRRRGTNWRTSFPWLVNEISNVL